MIGSGFVQGLYATFRRGLCRNHTAKHVRPTRHHPFRNSPTLKRIEFREWIKDEEDELARAYPTNLSDRLSSPYILKTTVLSCSCTLPRVRAELRFHRYTYSIAVPFPRGDVPTCQKCVLMFPSSFWRETKAELRRFRQPLLPSCMSCSCSLTCCIAIKEVYNSAAAMAGSAAMQTASK